MILAIVEMASHLLRVAHAEDGRAGAVVTITLLWLG